MKNLHSAYQGHFKEWLIAKGYIKNMNDLVKMIDKKWEKLIIFKIYIKILIIYKRDEQKWK